MTIDFLIFLNKKLTAYEKYIVFNFYPLNNFQSIFMKKTKKKLEIFHVYEYTYFKKVEIFCTFYHK